MLGTKRFLNPTLTLGLPVWNAAPFLEDALRSIFAQTFTDWELIAVDDGSQDDSAALLRRVNDPRVRVVVDGQHRGLGARLNQIIADAKGRYIARMDADDLMHPQRLARQFAFLEANAQVDVAGCGLVSFDAGEQPISVRHLPAAHAEITAHPLSGFPLAHASTVGRGEWWRKHRYNEQNRACEDWELWFESHRHSRFANLPELLYFYRETQAFSFRGYAHDKAALAALQWGKRTEVGAAAAGAAVMGEWARIGAYAAAHLLGAEQSLVRRRGQLPSEAEAAAFREALARIRATRLPG